MNTENQLSAKEILVEMKTRALNLRGDRSLKIRPIRRSEMQKMGDT